VITPIYPDTIINNVVGLPWKKGGRTPNEGFDCWGFFKWFYTNILNVDIQDEYSYQPGETKNIVRAFSSATGEGGKWVKVDEPTNYCAVALSMNKYIHHVGIWLEDGCLHATEGLGIVYNDMRQLKRNGYSKVEFYICQMTQQ